MSRLLMKVSDVFWQRTYICCYSAFNAFKNGRVFNFIPKGFNDRSEMVWAFTLKIFTVSICTVKQYQKIMNKTPCNICFFSRLLDAGMRLVVEITTVFSSSKNTVGLFQVP